MKKIIISLALIAAVSSCEKQNQTIEETSTTNTKNNSAISFIGGFGVKVKLSAGHPSSMCHGQGACFNSTPGYWPNYVHIPCQGSGKDCEWEFSLGTGYSQSDAVFGITGYQGEHFLMPDRSLLIPGDNVYLNIPRQTATKVEGGYQFSNLSLSLKPIFENL